MVFITSCVPFSAFMSIEIGEVSSRHQLRTFVYLTADIHKHHKNWIPPIYMDELSFFDPAKNLSFAHCEHIRLLAYKQGVAVGRIMGLVHHLYNERKNENNARFSYLETYDDAEVATALLQAVENWAKKLGCEKIVGPLGFSDKEPMGLMTEGYDNPLVLASNGNLPYMVKLVEGQGYTKEVGMVSYWASIPDEVPAVYRKIMPRVEEQLMKEFRVVEFNSRIKLRKYIYPVLNLTNKAFDHIYGSMPYNKHEMKDFANRFIWLLNPRFIKVIETREGEVIAYVIGMPDISEGIIASRGKILPFGIFKFFRAMKKTNRIIMLLGAIDERYRGRGLDVFLALRLFYTCRAAGKTELDSHLVLESNASMRAEYERIGGKIYKRYSLYQKKLLP